MAYVYILQSITTPSKIYVGITSSLIRRVNQHNAGKSLHTAKFRPWELVYFEFFEKFEDALRREAQIKGWSRAKKEALMTGAIEELKNLSRCRKRKDK